MKVKRKSYYNQKWFDFAKVVKHRDNNQCLRCGRNEKQATLQVHHTFYEAGKEPWDYNYSDCLTLCKGCHSREHNLVEPDRGWTLTAIDDLGGDYGICERKGCGTSIRYDHVIYHPAWGYKSVGSSCVDLLTNEDQYISTEVLKVLDKISDFLRKATWEARISKTNRTPFSCTFHAHHQIRIYGKENNYGLQVNLKIPGVKRYKYGELFWYKNKSLTQMQELAFIALKGKLAKTANEIKLLRNIYSNYLNKN